MTPAEKVNALKAIVGVFIISYVAYCSLRGEITARIFGAKARPILRTEQPLLFWFLVGLQIVVALMVLSGHKVWE